MSYKPNNMQDMIANLTFKDSEAATEFYKKSLGATHIEIMKADNGWVMHGNMRLGDSVVFFNDEAEFMPRKAPTGPQSIAFYVYVEDVDAAYKTAVENGMTSVFEPQTMFWGDRTAVVSDPFHYVWTLSTQVAEPSAEEILAGQKAMMDNMPS